MKKVLLLLVLVAMVGASSFAEGPAKHHKQHKHKPQHHVKK